MPRVADPVSGGLERVGVRLHVSQVAALRQIGAEKGEDLSTALRLIVRLGLQQFREMGAEEKLVA